MNGQPFTSLNQHWHHFLERDIPADAPTVQVDAMRKAFAAGAVSGLQLALLCKTNSQVQQHVDDIVALNDGTL